MKTSRRTPKSRFLAISKIIHYRADVDGDYDVYGVKL